MNDFAQLLKKRRLYLILTIIFSFVMWYQLEIGNGYKQLNQCLEIPPQNIIITVIALYILTVGVGIIFNSIGLSCMIMNILVTIISLINYHVITFRGLPLTILDVHNTRMAISIFKAYYFIWNAFTDTILICFLVQIIVALILHHYEKKNEIKWRKFSLANGAFLLAGLCFFQITFFSETSFHSQASVGWSWQEVYHQYGYLISSIEGIIEAQSAVREPVGYSDSKIQNIQVNNTDFSDVSKPDIILILNETFYDLKTVRDFETDFDYLENIHQMDHLNLGNVIVPAPGGGTNKSEYELLTSNSMILMSAGDPFNILNLKNANSIVSVLKQEGYQTLAAHSESGVNYSRITGYTNLGFDTIHFGEDFEKEYYGNRGFATDESLYKNLIKWYEAMDSSPRFLYLLTVQNHGAWDINDAELDTIHVISGIDSDTDTVNEYLSCISLSDQAFKKLTEYYSKVDRPVIICMVGDHAPAFVSDIIDKKYDDTKARLLYRTVPFLVWSNFNINSKALEPKTISMNYVVPSVLQAAGIKNLSYYYKYMNELKSEIPIICAYGTYIDSENNFHQYPDESSFAVALDQYLYMEYNNLSKNYRQELFEIP